MILSRRGFICTWVHINTSHTTRVFAESSFWACIYIFYSNRSYMIINFRGLDKYDSNRTGDRQTDGQTITEVRKGKIYEFVRSNVMTPGVTEFRKLITWLSLNVGN